MGFSWPYFNLDRNGYLILEHSKMPPFMADSRCAGPIQPHPFKSSTEAEEWLRENDIRGNVR